MDPRNGRACRSEASASGVTTTSTRRDTERVENKELCLYGAGKCRFRGTKNGKKWLFTLKR